MAHLVFESFLPFSREEVAAFHDLPDAVKILTDAVPFTQLVRDQKSEDGRIHELWIKKFGIPGYWKAEIFAVKPGHGFSDRALFSPFKSWVHIHEFLDHPDGCLLRDSIDYEPPLGILGKFADWIFIRHDLKNFFRSRHDATRSYLTEKRLRDGASPTP